jgi:hypothetical protein
VLDREKRGVVVTLQAGEHSAAMSRTDSDSSDGAGSRVDDCACR